MPVSPALPALYNRVPVRGRFVDLEGYPVAGKLVFTATVNNMIVAGNAVTVVAKPLVVWLDNTGYFQTNIPATDDPDVQPTGFLYSVTETFNGVVGRTYKIAVPLVAAGVGLDLSTVVPGPQVTDPYQFSLLRIEGGNASSVFTDVITGGGA